MNLHDFAVAVGHAGVAGGGQAVRAFVDAEPHTGNGRPRQAAAINREHVLQPRGFHGEQVLVAQPVDPVFPERDAVGLGALVPAVEKVLLVNEAEVQIAHFP